MVGGPLPFLAFTHSIVVAIVLGLIAGMGAVIAEVVADTRLQQTLDEAHLGTAYGFAFAASVGGIAVGALIAPLLVSLLGVSGALLAIAGRRARPRRDVRHADPRPHAPPPPARPGERLSPGRLEQSEPLRDARSLHPGCGRAPAAHAPRTNPRLTPRARTPARVGRSRTRLFQS